MSRPISPFSSHGKHQSGFTLIELSIVLVIIGLIVGGILVGRDLIGAAELRGIAKQVEEYEIAVNVFKTKYNCLPGDCPNATVFWGTAPGCTLLQYSANYSLPTCNGDGDGHLVGAHPMDANNTNASPVGWENLTFWQHLSNAGLIKGNYVGKPGGYNAGVIAGVNVPTVANFPAAVIAVSNETPPVTNHWYNDQPVFMTGIYNDTSPFLPVWPYLTPTQALSLDQKYDDGMPSGGKIRFDWGLASAVDCVSGSSYDTSRKSIGCHLFFLENF